MRKYLTALVVSLVILTASALSVIAANKIWVGEIVGFRLRMIDDNTVSLSFSLDEDTTNGRFGNFDDIRIAIISTSSDKLETKIILDGVSSGIFKDFDSPEAEEIDPIIESIKFRNLTGSFLNPDIQTTLSDRQIFSAEITIASNVKLNCLRVPIDKSNTSKIQLQFKLRIDEEPRRDDTGEKPGNVLEFTVDDFSEPLPRNLFDLSGNNDAQRVALDDYSDTDFVTFFYALKYMRPSRAKSLLAKKLSPWGWMEISDDHGLLVITDYVNYVRTVVESLVIYDQPVPQVEVSAKVIEITLSEKDVRGFVHTFKRDFPDAMEIQVGSSVQNNFFGLNGISGSVAHYSGSTLKQFLTMLNLASEKQIADVLASPRAVVINNATADFSVQQTYYYLSPSSFSRNDEYYKKGKEPSSKDDYTKLRPYESYGLKTIKTGVKLNVRPYILNGPDIECNIRLSYDEVIGFSGPNDLPVTANRSLNSVVRMKDGQTLVIGGLFREKDITVTKKIPGLGSIPVLSFLFSSKQKKRVKTELVFILTVNRVQ